MSRWFRHYAGMMRDEKLVSAAIRSKQTVERVLWVWGAILESAAEIDDGGRYDFDEAEAAYFLRADQDDITGIVAALAALGRIADGVVVKWGNRQFQSDRSRDRVAAFRKRKQEETVHSDDIEPIQNGDVTLQKRHRNAPETETETEEKAYAFSAGAVRLKPKDYRDWQKRFHTIPDFDAELHAMAAWVNAQPPEKQRKWFATGSAWMNKRHQEGLANRQRAGPAVVVGV